VRTTGIRVIEHDADIAAVGIATGKAHARPERIGQRNAEREQQRP
jgi:hypothetical protein